MNENVVRQMRENPMRKNVLATAMLVLALHDPVAAVEPIEREYIYGAELMTSKERDAYRANIERAGDETARQQYRQRHRERLQKRAGERRVELDEKGLVRSPEAGK